MYGIGLCILIAITAFLLSPAIPIGSVTIAIVLGIFIRNLLKPAAKFDRGIAFSEKHILSFAIALMGINLNYRILSQLGLKTLFLILASITLTLTVSILLGRLFHLNKRFSLLLGIGNAICGSSAIAATKEIVGANEEEAGLSIAIVNFLGTLGIFALPFIGSVVLNFSDANSGILIGNTLQAVGQVVAAGFSLGELSGQTATIVKMTRILMLTPLILILIFSFAGKAVGGAGKGTSKKLSVPVFVVGFVLFSLIPAFRLLPESAIQIISNMSKYALLLAMAGIGLKITFRSLVQDGKNALLLGTVIFMIQIIFSSCMIHLL